MTTSTALAFALLANLCVAATGCSGAQSDASDDNKDSPVPERDTPKAPAVHGPGAEGELTDAFGVFVAPSSAGGDDGADGTHEHPLATIRAGIELGKRDGKRVYVCAGTFHEAITVADSISIIGGLDCTNNIWSSSAARTRIEAPSSPAVRAAGIVNETRIEGLEIIAPSATTPSASSIGLIADRVTRLFIARTRIVAGDGANGTDGDEGTQLKTSTTANGAPFSAAKACDSSTCTKGGLLWVKAPGANGGTNLCDGSPGHAAEAGGAGGSGGLWQSVLNINYFWQYAASNAANAADEGIKNRTSATGTNGTDGTNGAALGTFTRDGYTPVTGTPGTNGAPGHGGAGGSGRDPGATVDASTVPANSVWRGTGGAGGGAGGCPGLAGSPGKGGGASIAAILIESPINLDNVELVAARGGTGGHGSFGSAPTAGGHAGSSVPTLVPFASGKDGGRGGAAGVSGNGTSGPSIGLVHVGAAPSLGSASRIFYGKGGAAIDARSRTDAFGIVKTIPETPAGTAKEVLAL